MTTAAYDNDYEEDIIAGATALTALNKDLREAAATLSVRQARFLVDYYYQMQRNRIRAGHQALKAAEASEPGAIARWALDNSSTLENNIRKVLDIYSTTSVVGSWSRSICGIGPVIAAGLLAHIDIGQAPTVGHIWRFAGLDPTLPRMTKGEKRPWNARLKVVTWKAGESFVKTSNNPRDIYGHIYAERKAYEQGKNEAGEYGEQAASQLQQFKYGKDTEAYGWYSQGKLPPAHIHARAKRYAVKVFLSHWHHVAYESTNGTPPPKPYILTQPGHVHFLAPPNWPVR